MNACEKKINLYAYEIQQLSVNDMDIEASLDDISKKRAEGFKSDKGSLILKLALNDDLLQKELDAILEEIDIEALHGDEALLFAYAKQKNKALNFGSLNEPRLKGLIQYYRFDNLNQFTFFSEIIKTLNDAGYSPLVSYELAMKYYEPKHYRIIKEAGVVASSLKQYQEFQAILHKSGYIILKHIKCFDVIDKSGNKRMRVYRNNVISAKAMIDGFESELFDSKCLIPSVEDAFCIMVLRIWQKLRCNNSYQGLGFDIWELSCFISKQKIKWDVVKEKISDNNLVVQYDFVKSFVKNVDTKNCMKELFDGNKTELLKDFLKNEIRYCKSNFKPNGQRRHQLLLIFFRKLMTIGANI